MAIKNSKIKLVAGAIVSTAAVTASVAATRIKQKKAREEGRHVPYGPYEALFKRPIDTFLASCALIGLSPLMVLTAFKIRKELGTPVIFKQVRPGMVDSKTGQEKLFELYKFRSMTDELDSKTGKLLPDEMRLTSFGKRLRATSVDELPELLNILKGDMAVVGPRPQLVRDMTFMTEEQRHRHMVRPGLSGLAQIRGRNALAWDYKLATDLEYVDSVTFLNDASIVFKTLQKVLFRKSFGESSSELDVTDDYGDWLLAQNAIDLETYNEKQATATELLARAFPEKDNAPKNSKPNSQIRDFHSNTSRSEQENATHLWVLNHYASCPDYPNEHRHHDLAKQLVRLGYRVTIIAASTMHNMGVNLIEDCSPVLFREYDGVEYIFVKTRDYVGNGKARVLNIWDYHKALDGIDGYVARPDVILASSPHPLSVQDGIKLAHKFGVPCICEVRDLWPESLVEYGYLSRNSPIAKALYAAEKKMYEESDAIIFTMEGGRDYVRDRGWDTASGGKVDLSKIRHINNGIDLKEFDNNLEEHVFTHPSLEPDGRAKLVYAGSVRQANDLGFLVDVAECMRDEPVDFVIIGDGDQRESLAEEAQKRELINIKFIGRVDKQFIPSALSKGMMMMMYSSSQTSLASYGMSQNKLFDYLASGKPIISNLPSRYSLINRNDCGVERTFAGPDDFASQIREMLADEEQMAIWSKNSRKVAANYSFDRHAKALEQIIFETISWRKEKGW